VVATDGRQLLAWKNFAFPWTDDVLIPGSRVLASRVLPRDRPVSVARTETHVLFRVGPWTLSFEARPGARFPRVDQVIPVAGTAATRLRLDGED
uniref:hypothetical protein n=1 Tax=Salmonella sp. SAL4445 TaxID=3159900 RepID=UPI003979512F